jgi:2-oxoglutarate dehydrogenase E2 component (dihydrolipoamide succinyltransferase)
MSSIKVPPLGESIVEATISRWLKNEGDLVAAGETLVELETDKITVEVPALEAGVLTTRHKGEGDVVNVGDELGEIAAGAGAARPAAPVAAAVAPVAAPVASASGPDVKVSPAAARLATEAGISPADIAGTGRGGVVSKPDVVAAIAAPAKAASAPAAAATPAAVVPSGTRETREKMTTRRKRIAENLLLSQHQTAHLTTFNEIDMTAITALRERLKDRVE